MKILIVYESFFGNTKKIAETIAAAMAPHGEVDTVNAAEKKAVIPSGTNILITGSPTRGFRPTPAIQKFMGSLAAGSLKEIKFAAFDTRVGPSYVKSGFLRFLMKTFGYAAKPIYISLKRRSGTPLAEPEGFLVVESEGPLKEGETERAAAWAESLVKTSQQ